MVSTGGDGRKMGKDGHTVAAMFGTELGNLLVSQTIVVIDVEVGEHLLDGCSKGALHGVGVADESACRRVGDGQRRRGFVV